MNDSCSSVPLCSAALLPECITVHLYDIFVKEEINRAFITPLVTTGVLLPMLATLTMRGTLTLTTVTSMRTIRTIVTTFVALGQESREQKGEYV